MNHYKILLSTLFTIIFMQSLTVASFAENPQASINTACHDDCTCCCGNEEYLEDLHCENCIGTSRCLVSETDRKEKADEDIQEQFPSPENQFMKLTGLDGMQAEIESGAKIEKVFYDNRLYSPYPKTGPTEFSTTDSEEIAALWDAVQKIEIEDDNGVFLTDWYPLLVFHLDSGSCYPVRFDHKMLYLSLSELYNLKNDKEFWDLLGDLYVKYTDAEADTPDDNIVANDGQTEHLQDTELLELTRIKIDGKYGYINEKGELVVPCEIDGAAFDFAEGRAIIKDRDTWLCLNTDGNIAFPFCSLYPVEPMFRDGVLIVWDKDRHAYGIIDREGARVVPCEYEKIERKGDRYFGLKDGEFQPLELKMTNNPNPDKLRFYHWETETDNFIAYFGDEETFTVLRYDKDMNLIETWQYWPKQGNLICDFVNSVLNILND